MAILVTISASAALILRGTTRAWRTGTLRTERYQQARLLFDLFGRELSSSVRNPRYPFLGTKPSDGPPRREGSVGDELYFVTLLSGRAGLIERGYWLAAEGQLMCHDDESADGDYMTGTSEACGYNVSQFTVSYFDGTQWLDRWDGRPSAPQAGQLPQAVHLVVSIGRERPEQFETVIHVPAS